MRVFGPKHRHDLQGLVTSLIYYDRVSVTQSLSNYDGKQISLHLRQITLMVSTYGRPIGACFS